MTPLSSCPAQHKPSTLITSYLLQFLPAAAAAAALPPLHTFAAGEVEKLAADIAAALQSIDALTAEAQGVMERQEGLAAQQATHVAALQEVTARRDKQQKEVGGLYIDMAGPCACWLGCLLASTVQQHLWLVVGTPHHHHQLCVALHAGGCRARRGG